MPEQISSRESSPDQRTGPGAAGFHADPRDSPSRGVPGPRRQDRPQQGTNRMAWPGKGRAWNQTLQFRGDRGPGTSQLREEVQSPPQRPSPNVRHRKPGPGPPAHSLCPGRSPPTCVTLFTFYEGHVLPQCPLCHSPPWHSKCLAQNSHPWWSPRNLGAGTTGNAGRRAGGRGVSRELAPLGGRMTHSGERRPRRDSISRT